MKKSILMNGFITSARTKITILGIIFILSCNAKEVETQISGELRQWHKVTLTVNGPFANESDTHQILFWITG